MAELRTVEEEHGDKAGRVSPQLAAPRELRGCRVKERAPASNIVCGGGHGKIQLHQMEDGCTGRRSDTNVTKTPLIYKLPGVFDSLVPHFTVALS